MGDNFAFGGGADGTNIHPAVLAATLLVAVLILVLPRKALFTPIALSIFLTPFGEQIYAGGFHFFTTRMLIFAGLIRMCMKPRSGGKLDPIEKTFCLWVFFRALTFILLYAEGGAFVGQLAFCLDAYGMYFLIRYIIRDKSDVFEAIKSLAVVAAILAVCMLYEEQTRVNVFNLIRVGAITPWIRDGGVRAQGTFANSICAGSIGATFAPLLFWLWKSGKAKLSGVIGLVSCATIVITSAASTPFSGFLAGILALCAWPLRGHMRSIRWGIVFTVICLALVMKAPIWYLLAKIDFVGGHGWDRAYLVDQFVHHVSNWWLLGTKDNASWGADTWDQCNQFVAEGESGGMITLVLFVTILTRGFASIGRARKRFEGAIQEEWLYWCMGAALFSHVIVFLGIDYFDQNRIWWFAFLAMISAATALTDDPSPAPAEQSAFELAAAGSQ